MFAMIRALIASHELLYIVAWREIKIKYKQSVMGFFWAILMPTLIVGAGVIVKYAFASLSGSPLDANDIANVAVKSTPWAFFVSSLRFAANSLVANTTLVTKVYLPREVFPIASVASQLMDFVVASSLLVIILPLNHIGLSIQIVWVPLLVLFLILFTVAVALFVAAASLFFRDIKYLVDVFVTFGIFFTPVFYDAATLGKWGSLVMLNPVAPILEGLSSALVYHRVPNLGWVAYSAVASVALLFATSSFLRKLEPYFAESI